MFFTWLPYLVRVKKLELFIPWWFLNRVQVPHPRYPPKIRVLMPRIETLHTLCLGTPDPWGKVELGMPRAVPSRLFYVGGGCIPR